MSNKHLNCYSFVMKPWNSRQCLSGVMALALCVSTFVRGGTFAFVVSIFSIVHYAERPFFSELQDFSQLAKINCSGELWNPKCNVRRAQSALDEVSESVIVEVNLTASETTIVSPAGFSLTMGSYIQLSIKDNVNVLSTRVRILKEDNLGLRTGGNYLIQLFLRVSFQYVAPSSGEIFDIKQWIKNAFDTGVERRSFIELLRDEEIGDIQQLQSMKLELDTFSTQTVSPQSFGVGAILGVLSGVLIGIVLGCLLYFLCYRKPELKIKDAQSTDSTNRMEILVSNTGGDDISTLGDPYCGSVAVSKADEKTSASSLAYDYSKNVKNHDEERDVPSQDCYTEATPHTRMSIGMEGSLLADDQSFDNQYDDDEELDFEKFMGDVVNENKNTEIIKVIVAPGKLGIVLDDKPGIGPVIHAIKPTSPLFGSVQVGDQIINMNDEKISHMAAYDISRLISEKSDEDRIFEFHRLKIQEV